MDAHTVIRPGETWTMYSHDVAWNRPDRAWAIDYPNGWSRRSIMNFQGQVLYTRWIRPDPVVT